MYLRDTVFLEVDSEHDFDKVDKEGPVKSIQFSSLGIEFVIFVIDLWFFIPY